MKKYCIFDFDGTLVDSMGEWARAMTAILDAEGIKYPDNIINILTPLGNMGAAELFLKMGVRGTKGELINRMSEYAFDAYSTRIRTKNGVKEFLEKLKRNGHVLAVLTASPHVTLDACLENNGIYGLFDKIWSVEDFGMTKSVPEIYTEACRLLGAKPSETVFFDDNLTAISTAKSAGLMCVGVYDFTSDGDTEKIKEQSDLYIKSFEELL